MLERYLIEHCAPTLASIKTANLFSFTYTDERKFEKDMVVWNENIRQKGVALILLRKSNGRALVYVCRIKRIQQDLVKPGVAEFLSCCGYEDTRVEGAIATLKTRLKENEEFPHEIGLFLGYPLEDVIGFIENAGKNPKCTGCWKVYCNECEAIKTFALYKKCSSIYMRLWEAGKSVLQLTVAA